MTIDASHQIDPAIVFLTACFKIELCDFPGIVIDAWRPASLVHTDTLVSVIISYKNCDLFF